MSDTLDKNICKLRYRLEHLFANSHYFCNAIWSTEITSQFTDYNK